MGIENSPELFSDIDKSKTVIIRSEILPIVSLQNAPLFRMIEGGRYTKVDSRINFRNFQLRRTGKNVKERVEMAQIISFPAGNMNENNVRKEFEGMKLKPADLNSFLSFGAQYPKIQQRIIIVTVAPDSVWRSRENNRYILRLRGNPAGDRCLDIDLVGEYFPSYYCFLGIQK